MPRRRTDGSPGRSRSKRTEAGAPGGIRTPDTRFRRPMLWSTELRARGGRHHTESCSPPPGRPIRSCERARWCGTLRRCLVSISRRRDVVEGPASCEPPCSHRPRPWPSPSRSRRPCRGAMSSTSSPITSVPGRSQAGSPWGTVTTSRSSRTRRRGVDPVQRPTPPLPRGPDRAGRRRRPGRAARRQDPDGLRLAHRAPADHAAVRADPVGHVRRRRRALPRRHRHRHVLRRPDHGRPCRHGHRRGPSLRFAAGLGRRPGPIHESPRVQGPVVGAAAGRGHRRRERLSQHVRALRGAACPARPEGARRPAAGLRGRDRPRDRLPSPLRAVFARRDGHLQAQRGDGEADEAATPRARAGRPVQGPAAPPAASPRTRPAGPTPPRSPQANSGAPR